MTDLSNLIEREERIKRELLGLVKQALDKKQLSHELPLLLSQIETQYIPPLQAIQDLKRKEIARLYTCQSKADLQKAEDWEFLESKQETVKELDKEILQSFQDLQSLPQFLKEKPAPPSVTLALDHSQDLLQSLLGKSRLQNE